MKFKEDIKKALECSEDKFEFINELNEFIHSISPARHNPVDLIRYVPVEKVQANDYNPNTVATNELKLLYTSVSHDGYTQPVVTIYDGNLKKYIIVDGFHRYFTLKNNEDLMEKNSGRIPIVVIEKDINDRMASTIRHNRARGKHSVTGMSDIVFNMLDNGWTDAQICNELGMEIDELIKLKHITGFSKLFENVKYKKAWETKRQIQIKKEYEKENEESIPV